METIKTGKLYRDFSITKGDIDQEKRTVSLSFSSETPVVRQFGIEILEHTKTAVDLRRLKRGGALLIDHDMGNQVGVIEEALIDEADRKGRASVRFGRSAKAEEIFQDVVDGIRSNVSMGYVIHEVEIEGDKDNKRERIIRAKKWEPLEISIVSIPADVEVGIGRAEGELKEIKITNQGEVNMETKDFDIKVIESDVRAAEQKRIAEIYAIGERHKCMELARNAVLSGISAQDFGAQVLDTVYKATPVQADAGIVLSEKENREYSLVRAIKTIAEGGKLDGIEKEVSDATAKICKREARGFYIPQNIEKRVMQASDSTKGGFTVGTEVLGGELIELLRNKPLVAQLGARTLAGLVGNVAIPKVTGGASAYWLSEVGTVTASDQAFGQLAFVPKRLVGDTAYTKELLIQSSIDVENFVRDDLMTVLAIEKDRAAINGLGANGEPLGILTTTGVKTVTFGGAPSWAKVVDFETQLEASNAQMNTLAYLTTPAVKGKWKSTPVVSGQAIFLWDRGVVNGYRAEATNQVPSNLVIFGNWSDLIFAEWAGVDVVVDPYSLKKQGQIEITVTLYCDIGIRNPVSFCISTDSGAQ